MAIKRKPERAWTPFNAERVEDLALPFCACGRLWSECDGSRAACQGRNRPRTMTRDELGRHAQQEEVA